MSDDEIVLRLDRTTAKYLLGALHDLGEHLAAGVPIGPMAPDENERLRKLIRELRRSLRQDESEATRGQQESAATDQAERDGRNDNEDEILVRAIGDVGASRRARWAARRLKTVAHEEEIIVDLPAIAVAATVHAALTSMKYPLLPGQLATFADQYKLRWIEFDNIGKLSPVATFAEQYKVRWIDVGGIGKLNPVLITVSVMSEAYGTALRIRGAAKEGITEQRSAQKSVDRLTGILCDLFDKWEIIDVMD
jgi:hypothetical protein